MAKEIRAPNTTRHLEQLQKIARGEVAGPPIAELIGFTPSLVEVGHAVMEMDVSKRHANPMGTLHGGVICDIADAAMGYAMSSTLEDDETFTTLDLTANFFKPVWNAHLRAEAKVTRRTRSLGFIECEVLDESGSVVAKSFSTCMVLRGKDAAGRRAVRERQTRTSRGARDDEDIRTTIGREDHEDELDDVDAGGGGRGGCERGLDDGGACAAGGACAGGVADMGAGREA